MGKFGKRDMSHSEEAIENNVYISYKISKARGWITCMPGMLHSTKLV